MPRPYKLITWWCEHRVLGEKHEELTKMITGVNIFRVWLVMWI